MRNLHGRTLLSAVTLITGAALLTTPSAGAATSVPAGRAPAGPVPATPQVPASASASGYRIVDLGALPGDNWSAAMAINNRGHVAGFSDTQPVLWRNGRVIDLGGLPGARYSIATDLNERDEVVGYSVIPVGDEEDHENVVHPFLWRKGRIHDLGGLPGGDHTFATGINDKGEIVGRAGARPGALYMHAVLWRHGRIVELQPGQVLSYAEDITNNGWIVGFRGTPEDPMNYTQAVAWRNRRSTLLFTGTAQAANERHQVVGHAGGPVLWARGVVTRLPMADDDIYADPGDINEWGQIVGGSDSGPVLWQRGGFSILPDLNGNGGATAGAINDRGQIAGTAALPDSSQHAVLWTR